MTCKEMKVVCIEKIYPQYLLQIEVGNQYMARLSHDSVSSILFVTAGTEEIPIRYYNQEEGLYRSVEAVFKLIS